ncbi:MAG: hypothetical protein NVSMB64_16440 [Candidatus Velthaea sp.]
MKQYAAVPARADEMSEVQAKVSAALKAAKSFVATTLIPAAGASTTSVFVAPDRVKTEVASGAQTFGGYDPKNVVEPPKDAK